MPRPDRIVCVPLPGRDTPHEIGEADRRAAGFTDDGIFDVTNVAAFFNHTNRTAHGLATMPNPDHRRMDR